MGIHLRLGAPHQGYGSLPDFTSGRDTCQGFDRRGHYTSGKTMVGQAGEYEGSIRCVTGLMPASAKKSKSQGWGFRRGGGLCNAGACSAGMMICGVI